jgi:hypothetical protein
LRLTIDGTIEMLPENHEHDNGYENDERDDVFAHNPEWRKTGAFDKGVENVLPDEDTGKKNPGNNCARSKQHLRSVFPLPVQRGAAP